MKAQSQGTTLTTAVATTATAATATATVSAGTPPPMPRSFEGTFATVRRAFGGSRPYDYQLNDSTGARFAYLDLATMTGGQRIATYDGQKIIVHGTMQPVPGTKDIVIKVETLQAK
jgi:hypothetical protein